MRVLMTRRDERGAVAITVSMLAVTILLMAGFITDFGQAYVNKRQLQTASDAAALAAAKFYQENLVGPCTQSAIDALRPQAEVIADDYREQNRSGSEGDILPGASGIHCKGKGVEVIYLASGSTPAFFAPIIGGSNKIPVWRQSAAAYDNDLTDVGKIRPWGVCTSVIDLSGNVTFVGIKNAQTRSAGAPACSPTSEPAGGWWVMLCDDGTGSTGNTGDNVTFGCNTNITPVPDQTSHMTSPSDLWGYLTTFCPSKTVSETCLKSDTGYNVKNFDDEWQPLVGQTITMPVMCDTPKCSALAVDGTGSTASYAVHQIAIVELCGFGLHGQYSTNWPTDDCTAKNVLGYQPTDIKEGSAGFFMVFKGIYGADAGDGNFVRLRLTK